MAIEDLPVIEIPFPEHHSSLSKPIIVTKEYYDKLTEAEKMRYTPLKNKTVGGQKDE